ncbi:hypothetical protein GY45DRAFT_1340926 [Cubamyces sp. BRFM 1775]|nr:hypothetical protein GY45DRAFT_1340926 [Cubamyces sp. BRFM 1775]
MSTFLEENTANVSLGPVASALSGPAGSIGIGIETEFLLTACSPPAGEPITTLRNFARHVARHYNKLVPPDLPRMQSSMKTEFDGQHCDYLQWGLHRDATCVTDGSNGCWGIEAISPLLRMYPGSPWRSQVEAFRAFLLGHYIVTGNNNCSTHVHVSRAEGYTPDELKRIACTVIHFEPAFEAILPPSRRGNRFARSNWIDNPIFRCWSLSCQGAAMTFITDVLKTREQLIDTMNPDGSKYYGWNFTSIRKYKMIKFRRGPVSKRHRRLRACMISGCLDLLFADVAPEARLEPLAPYVLMSTEWVRKLARKLNANALANRQAVLDMLASAKPKGVL